MLLNTGRCAGDVPEYRFEFVISQPRIAQTAEFQGAGMPVVAGEAQSAEFMAKKRQVESRVVCDKDRPPKKPMELREYVLRLGLAGKHLIRDAVDLLRLK